MLDEHFAQLVEIRVLQTLVGNDIVENRNILRNGDALVLRYVLYPISRLAFRIFSRVESFTEKVGSSFKTLETVAWEKPTRFAISLIVAIRILLKAIIG